MRGERGQSLVEILAALAILSLLFYVGVPSFRGLRERAALGGASSEMATMLRSLRSRAIAQGRTVALVFDRAPGGWQYGLFADGDGDGVRSSDIADGTDYPLAAPARLGERWNGIEFGCLPLSRIRRLPPASGWTAPPQDPIQFGAAKIVSFSALGDASTGTLYLSDGRTRMAAIVLFGPTARVRVFRYDLSSEEWST